MRLFRDISNICGETSPGFLSNCIMKEKKLLIVDDEPDILEFLKKCLERNNFKVIAASSGRECLDKASQEEPDLILLDIVMPFMDGYEVIKKLRNNRRTKHIPIVMHSVKKETRSIFRCMELGSIDYVTKPISVDVLVKVIRRYV